MEEKKAERLEKEATRNRTWRQRLLPEVHRAFLQTCPMNAIVPPAAELYLFEPFRAVIEDQTLDLRQEDGIKIFEKPMKQLNEMVLTWRAEKDSELLKMMKKAAKTKSKLTSEHLNLATTYFKYESNVPIAYPRVLALRCSRSYGTFAEFNELFTNVGGCVFWNMNGEISFHSEAAAAARIIVETCGFDPMTATTAELEAMDPIIECVSCLHTTRGHCIMSWKQAVCSYNVVLESKVIHIARRRLRMRSRITMGNPNGNSSLMKRCRQLLGRNWLKSSLDGSQAITAMPSGVRAAGGMVTVPSMNTFGVCELCPTDI
jgi:hypothetical protein